MLYWGLFLWQRSLQERRSLLSRWIHSFTGYSERGESHTVCLLLQLCSHCSPEAHLDLLIRSDGGAFMTHEDNLRLTSEIKDTESWEEATLAQHVDMTTHFDSRCTATTLNNYNPTHLHHLTTLLLQCKLLLPARREKLHRKLRGKLFVTLNCSIKILRPFLDVLQKTKSQ